jgi:hypothetical protein
VPQKKHHQVPVQQQQYTKPSKPFPPAPTGDGKKFRHATPRKGVEVKFAPKSAIPLDELEEFTEESRRPAYPYQFNNFQPVPHIAEPEAPLPQRRKQQPAVIAIAPAKPDVHLKTSFFEEAERERIQKIQHHAYTIPTSARTTPTTTATTSVPEVRRIQVTAGLSVKGPQIKHPASSPTSGDNVRLIVARKSTTVAPVSVETSPTTTTTTTSAPVQHHQRHHVSQQPQAPEEAPQPQPKRQRPTPFTPVLPYTPRPFSAFLEAAVKLNGQGKRVQAQSQQELPSPTTISPTEYVEGATPRATRKIVRKKLRNPNPSVQPQAQPEEEFQFQRRQPQHHHQHQPQSQPQYQTVPPRTAAPTQYYTTQRTTSTTYQFDDYYNGGPTKATKNYGFDIYGTADTEDEEEELVRAAQEYYQGSEFYGRKQRSS